jgi:hypothetical protein
MRLAVGAYNLKTRPRNYTLCEKFKFYLVTQSESQQLGATYMNEEIKSIHNKPIKQIIPAKKVLI